jgi:hypothetical protein
MDGLKMRYFVLSPTKDDAFGEASRDAMRAYANRIRFENPVLAKDLLNWAYEIQAKIDAEHERETMNYRDGQS